MIIKPSAEPTGATTITAPAFSHAARIIIADADAAFVSSLSNYLVAQPGYNVVAKVGSCADALTRCEELSPDILILDWHLMFEALLPADVNGVSFLKTIKSLKKTPSVIIASRLSLDDHRTTAMHAGADEFMPKAKFPQMVRPLITRLVPQF
jgi:DNA-binding NarL/FixJ family response regulator